MDREEHLESSGWQEKAKNARCWRRCCRRGGRWRDNGTPRAHVLSGVLEYGAGVMRRVLIAILLLAPCWSPIRATEESAALAGEILMIEKGPGINEVTLHWTGGRSPWEVFRSTDPASVASPASLLAETASTGGRMAPPPDAEPLVLHRSAPAARRAAPEPHQLGTCDICDTWGLTWAPVACTDHYDVRWEVRLQPRAGLERRGRHYGR